MENYRKMGNLIVIEGGRDTMPPGKQPRADYLLRAEQVADIPKSQVRRPRLPSTGAGKSRIHHGQLEVPPGRKERVVEKINQLETRQREEMLTSGATELLRSLKVELGKIESMEKSAR